MCNGACRLADILVAMPYFGLLSIAEQHIHISQGVLSKTD